MARVLLCWELGGGLGHLVPLAEAGRELERAGHEVAFALRDLAYANALLDLPGSRIYQAPLLLPLWRDDNILPETFADILYAIGYRDSNRLTGLLVGWRQIFSNFKPDLIVHDHSPTAMAAARGLEIPAIGLAQSGFTLPPPVTPMPDLRGGDSENRDAQHAREKQLVDILNGALSNLGIPTIKSIAELFELDGRVLLSIPELDAYGPRDDVEYWGPLDHGRGNTPEWPASTQSNNRKILVYVKAFDTRDALLESLSNSGHSVLAHIGGMDAQECARRSTATMTLSPEILDIRQALAECDLVVTHGGSLVASALLAGKPVLTLPLYLEQQITAEKLQGLGAGLNAPQRLPRGMLTKLQRLLTEDAFTAAAQDIASKYNGQFQSGIGRITHVVDTLLTDSHP